MDILNKMKQFYDNIISKALNTKSDVIDSQQLQNFANFVCYLIDAVGMKGYAMRILSLNYAVMQQLSPRMGTHRFTLKQKIEEGPEFFDYFDNVDRIMENFTSDIDLENFSENFSQVMDLLDENPPTSISTSQTISSKDKMMIKEHFSDFLDCISDNYESFLVLSLYFLILFKLFADQEIDKEFQALVNNRKLPANQLYHNPQKADIKLLKEYLQDSPFQQVSTQLLLDHFDTIFGDEGIRQLRNRKIHHYREEKMQFVNEYTLEVQFPTGRKQQFSLRDIYRIKVNFQLTVFLGFYIINTAFYHMLYDILQIDSKED